MQLKVITVSAHLIVSNLTGAIRLDRFMRMLLTTFWFIFLNYLALYFLSKVLDVLGKHGHSMKGLNKKNQEVISFNVIYHLKLACLNGILESQCPQLLLKWF